jgi:alpha/beta superfamily hydrolase
VKLATGTRIEAHFLFVKAARALCAAGMNVLRFDFRGSGESDGGFEEMTIEGEVADALAALERVRAEPTVDPDRVALLGLSLGGLVAACAAARNGAVSALVLWAAVADLMGVFGKRGDWDQVEERLARDGFVEWGAHRIGRGFFDDCQRVDPLAEVAGYRGPALVVHGSEDASVPVAHARMYMDALAGTDATSYIVQGADHTFTGVLTQEGGRLRMQEQPAEGQNGNVVLWCKQDFPRDFVCEWEFTPNEVEGLCIVFFCAQGLSGEDIFDPSLAPRDGTFTGYTNGDIHCYHISYFRNTCGRSPNCALRKNPNFYRTSAGYDYIPLEAGVTSRIMLVKRGAHIQFAINDRISIDWVDDGVSRGPIWGAGKIGLRQMVTTDGWYDNFRVWAVR